LASWKWNQIWNKIIFGESMNKLQIHLESAVLRMQKRIFELLYNDVLSRVPVDTGRLKEAIRTNSRIEGNKIIIGSGNLIEYAFYVEHRFEDPKNPRILWKAKVDRMQRKHFDASSTIPYLRAAVYKNIMRIIEIIVEELRNEFEGVEL